MQLRNSTRQCPPAWGVIASGMLLVFLTMESVAFSAEPDRGGPVRSDSTPESQFQSVGQTGREGGIDYRVEFEGATSGRLGDLFEQSSLLVSLADRKPATVAALERRAVGDLRRLSAVLHSDGYFDGTVDYRVDTDTDPVTVTLVITRGDPYLLESFDITYVGGGDFQRLPEDAAEIGIELNRRARAPDIAAAEKRMERILWERGYPFGRTVERQHVLDRAARRMRVAMTVEPGPAAGFGELSVEGVERVRENYIRRIQPWQVGQLYDRRLIDEYRQDLIDTTLFASVAIVIADALDEDGTVPIRLAVEEREQRTIGGGLSWGTDEGFLLSAFWEHRNLLREDENLRVETRLGEIEQSVTTLFSKPRFLRNDQTLLARAWIKREDTDAYTETNMSIGAGLERELNETWDAKGGITLELSDITENRESLRLWILGFPAAVVRDGRDDEMDPTRGTRLWIGAAPYLTAGDESHMFVGTEVNASAYKSVHRDDRIVLAGRVRAGSILGESRAEIPASKRFYAGGGGSIRGYQYQRVGPLDDQNDPIGGRSVLEGSVEIRFRLTDRIGVVPFVDAGTVFTDSEFTTEGDDTIRWAAGIGGRYFTVIGPVRLDVAFPVNKRDVDDDFQFYVSIGQAF